MLGIAPTPAMRLELALTDSSELQAHNSPGISFDVVVVYIEQTELLHSPKAHGERVDEIVGAREHFKVEQSAERRWQTGKLG